MKSTRKVTCAAVFILMLASSGRSQGNGLTVRADPANSVAQALVGAWQLDAELTKRLGGAMAVTQFEFRSERGVAAKVPQAIADKLRDLPLYQEGMMQMAGKPHPYLLTVKNGNAMVVWFRERDGGATGDAESFLVAVARGRTPANDVLLLGGDRAETPMVAFARKVAEQGEAVGAATKNDKGPQEPQAVLANMIELLEAGKGREFVETFCAPDDLKEMLEQGRDLDRLAKRFEGERATIFATMLHACSKLEPMWNEARTEVSWQVEERPGRLKLKQLDGRWYIANR